MIKAVAANRRRILAARTRSKIKTINQDTEMRFWFLQLIKNFRICDDGREEGEEGGGGAASFVVV